MLKALERESEKYVLDLFRKELHPNMMFHNVAHTKHVVSTAKSLGKNANISEQDILILAVAAWFHDIGYLRIYQGHESESIRIFESFADEMGCPAAIRSHVIQCISATKVGVKPTTLLQAILKDADLSHLGSTSFFEVNQRLKDEWEAVLGDRLTDHEFYLMNAAFMDSFFYYSQIAIDTFSDQWDINRATLNKRIKDSTPTKSTSAIS